MISKGSISVVLCVFPACRVILQNSETNILVFFVDIYPLSNFPQGGKVKPLLPPWGKVGKGVIKL
jgi:hypothetical protein